LGHAVFISELRPRCPAVRDVILIGHAEWADLITAGRAADPARLAEIGATLSSDDPINIQYTSGTTGFPKGAVLSHHNIVNNGFFVAELQQLTERDRICIPVPFYHCFGMVMGNLGATTHGACMVIPAPAFERKAALHAVHAAVHVLVWRTDDVHRRALRRDFDSFDLSSLRRNHGCSPCPVEVMKKVIVGWAYEVTICRVTETSPVSTQTRVGDTPSSGLPPPDVHPHLEIKLVDVQTGLTVPRDDQGELCTRGYSVMLGYWNEPEKTAEVIDVARWMHTGDLATMDDDGYVSITGRSKDMVIRGGENVYPREVEEFLYTHPDILDAQAIGVPDEKYGEEIMAWIRMRPGAEPLTADSLRAYCAGQLAHYKIPRYVHIVDEFPMTVTGKIRKVEMRARAVEILGLD
jgi:fatty-acyl-CoA synthase